MDIVARNFQVPAVKLQNGHVIVYIFHITFNQAQRLKSQINNIGKEQRLQACLIKKPDEKAKKCVHSESCMRPVSYTHEAPRHFLKRWCSN